MGSHQSRVICVSYCKDFACRLDKAVMIESLRHFFGLCGEPHPNAFWLFGSLPFLGGLATYFKARYFGRGKKDCCK